MALNIKDPETDHLARELAGLTGESLTTAVNRALQERIERIHGRPQTLAEKRARIDAILARASALPILDDRTPDEIIGYGEDGLPL